MMKSEEVHELPSDEVQREQSWLHAAPTTRLSGEEHTEQRKQQKIPSTLPFSWNLPRQKQNPIPHFAWSKRLYSDFTNPLFINTFVPVHFYFKYELLPKATFMLSKILIFPFTKALLYFLVLGEFYLGLYMCTKTQLFHFFSPLFFSHRKTCLYQPPN